MVDMLLHNPKYVGYWKSGNETPETIGHQSLFLMFINGESTDDNWVNRGISGDMQDFHGFAHFEGNLTEGGKKIIFKKINYKEEGKKELSGIATHYKGERKDEKSFTGVWESLGDNGVFALDEYGALFEKNKNTPLTPLNLMDCEIRKLQIRYSENISRQNGLKS